MTNKSKQARGAACAYPHACACGYARKRHGRTHAEREGPEHWRVDIACNVWRDRMAGRRSPQKLPKTSCVTCDFTQRPTLTQTTARPGRGSESVRSSDLPLQPVVNASRLRGVWAALMESGTHWSAGHGAGSTDGDRAVGYVPLPASRVAVFVHAHGGVAYQDEIIVEARAEAVWLWRAGQSAPCAPSLLR